MTTASEGTMTTTSEETMMIGKVVSMKGEMPEEWTDHWLKTVNIKTQGKQYVMLGSETAKMTTKRNKYTIETEMQLVTKIRIKPDRGED